MIESDKKSKESPVKLKKLPRMKKEDIHNPADFIIYAFSRQGKSCVIDTILNSTDLEVTPTDDIKQLVQKEAQSDFAISVPLQIFLASENESTGSRVRLWLKSIFRLALESNPIIPNFCQEMDKVPSTLSPSGILKFASEFKFKIPNTANDDQEQDIYVLRKNLIYMIAVWLVRKHTQPVNFIAQELGKHLWEPAAIHVRDRNLMQVLVAIDDLKGVGSVVGIYNRLVEDAERLCNIEQRKFENCLTQIRDLQDAALIRDNRVHDLELLIATLEGKIETLAKEGSIKEKNARDDFERWRTRLVRTLKDATDLLNNGLVAIRRHPPHIDVIDDHVQRVFDSLTSHIKALHEDFKP